MDPPYWNTAGYDVDWAFDNYQVMADLAKSIKGKMIISVNDIPEMREVFKDLHIERTTLKHTVGGRGGVERGELIVRNF